MILRVSILLRSVLYASLKHLNIPSTILKITYLANQSLDP